MSNFNNGGENCDYLFPFGNKNFCVVDRH